MAQNCMLKLQDTSVLLFDFYNLYFPFLGPKYEARGHEIFKTLKKIKVPSSRIPFNIGSHEMFARVHGSEISSINEFQNSVHISKTS